MKTRGGFVTPEKSSVPLTNQSLSCALSPRQLESVFRPYSSAFSRMSYQWNHGVGSLVNLAAFSECRASEVRPCGCVVVIPFHRRGAFPGRNVPVHLSICQTKDVWVVFQCLVIMNNVAVNICLQAFA